MNLIHRKLHTATYAGSAARTASGNSQATPIDCSTLQELNLFINVTAVSGTSPTLDITFQCKDPLSGVWMTHTTAAQITAVGTQMLKITANIASLTAIAWTIAGTTPSFTFSVGAALKT